MATGVALNSASRIWGPYKELYQAVEAAIHRKQADAVHDLEALLRKHKPDFISLLKNPAKNITHRDQLKKAKTEGITIQGQPGIRQIEEQFIQEACIISDLFDLNEYAAAELLFAAESQLPQFPGLTRGLVAVVLYYDGRVSIVNALRTLIQSREGKAWTLELGEELVTLTTKYTDVLMQDGMTNNILDFIKRMDVTKEMDRLQRERGLGDPKHRRQVTDLYKEIKLSLAECLYCMACQSSLSKDDTIRVVMHLKLDDGINADGTLDPVTLALLMTVLYSIDVTVLEQEEDSQEIVQKLPIISDQEFVPSLHEEICSTLPWRNTGLQAIVQFAWSQTLRSLSQYPAIQGLADCCEQDEFVFDSAIQKDVFQFLKESVVGALVFHQEEFYVRRIDGLITDFIVQMPLKVKELRNRGDEAARILIAHEQEGLQPPPSLRRDFEHLLLLIADLYVKDPLNLELSSEYWCPQESGVPSIGGSQYYYRPPQKQVSLFKFVRLAGDLLPPSMYIPYIKMLTGLANGTPCAHHCFNLLKTNGMQAGSHSSSVSWDHFFSSLSQYYASLRQEVPSSSETSHVYRHSLRSITAQELEGLLAVLELTRQVAAKDENARTVLCENQQWLLLVLLFGLVSCSVPAALKAQLLRVLAAFGKSPDIAASMWQSLEVSQIVPTIPGTAQKVGGIKVELDQIEARNEEFPMTRAFLELLSVLTDIPVPEALGAGYRAPGFDPYLDFICDSVFLRFSTRAYKNPGEKWQVAEAALSVLYKLLRDHEIQADDFINHQVELQGGGIVSANKPPGHNIMVHMLNDGGLIKTILYIVDDSIREFQQYTQFAGKEHLQNACLLCLKILECTLEKQLLFLDVLRDSGSPLLISPLDKLLLGVNRRSGKADHLVNVARFVCFNATMSEHAMYAVKILCRVSRSAFVQPELVGMFTASESISQDLLHGFVECLECDEVEEPDSLQQEDEELSVARIHNATRQHIMKLLLYTVGQPAPNVAHFLLGYELRKPVSRTNLQDPGILGSPRTCLHSVIHQLDKGVGTRSGPTCLVETPKFAELGYHLLYVICANKDTSTPTMRYLRTTHDFLYRHLQHVPFTISEQVEETVIINQQSWLLKTVALELRLTSLNRQRSHTQRLVNMLLQDTDKTQIITEMNPEGTYQPDFTQFGFETSMFDTSRQARAITGGQTRRKILNILDSIDFGNVQPVQPELQFFDRASIERVVKSFEHKDEQGVLICDVKGLYRVLNSNLANSTVAGQWPEMFEEIKVILCSVVSQNAVRQCIHAKKQAFESWRQAVEVILTACPVEVLCGEARQNVLFELLQDIFVKVSEDNVLPELTSPVAGVILTLVANLRQCFLTEESDVIQLQHSSQYITLLDNTALNTTSHTGFATNAGSRTLFASSLQVVLRGLTEHVLRSSGGKQGVRANLYGALLYYLQIARRPTLLPTLQSGQSSAGTNVLSRDSEYDKLVTENLATVLSYGENFMDVLCRDACDGHDVGRMLALASLDAIVSIDRHQAWLTFMTSKGYLRYLVDSLVQDGEKLENMLSPTPEPLKALYIYESKMGLLTRVAESVAGATNLLQSGIMTRLAECRFLSVRPEHDRHTLPSDLNLELSGFVPTVLGRYRQILFPALKLCLACMTSLGIENKLAAKGVLDFVLSHAEMFNNILRDRNNSLSLSDLEELTLTTAVIGRAASEGRMENELISSDTGSIELRGHLSRIERQLIALLPKYSLSQNILKQVRSQENRQQEPQAVKGQAEIFIHEIASNVIAYCRTIVSTTGNTAQDCHILFGPNLVEATARDMHSLDEFQTTSLSACRPPNLGVIVYELRQCASQFMTAFDSHKQALRKLNTLPELSTEEIKELSGTNTTEKMSSQQRQQLAKKQLVQTLAIKAQEIKIYSYIIENCLFILWRHLDFYLIHCIPTDTSGAIFLDQSKRHAAIRKLQDQPSSSVSISGGDSLAVSQFVSSGVSKDDLDQLKKDAPSCINETLFKKLQEIEQCYSRNHSRFGFMEALIRRLKRLLRLHTANSS